MPLKSYFSNDSSAFRPEGGGVGGTVIAWHLGWSGCLLLGLVGLLFLPASLFVLAAVVVMTFPGIGAIALLSRDTPVTRRALLWGWSLASLTAVSITGGIAGPLAIWVAMPMAAAIVLNQRSLISLGVALSLMAGLFSALVSLSGAVHVPDEQEGFWLSLIAVLLTLTALGIGLLPALRVRTERAVDSEEARARLLRVLTEQPHLILSLDEAGRVQSAYGEAPPGLDLNQLMQSGLTGAVHVPDRPAVLGAIETALTKGRADVGFMPHAALDHYLLLSLRRASDDRLYGVLHDGSLQHAREAALEAARAEAETSSHGKTRFLASMSHELRTPLNAVIGFSDIMRLQMFGPLPTKYAEYAQLIWESGQHVLDMINDVLDMSKIEAQKYELQLETFDIREPVSQALRLMRGQAHDKGIEIFSQLPHQGVPVTADKRAIKQIALNLLSNAIKFTPRGGDVRLTLEPAEEAVTLIVADTGIGIAPDDVHRMGLPYEQAGAADMKAQGTGLGLSIVKAMTHLHGGAVTIHSDIGEGTTVTIRLPVVAQQLLLELPEAGPVAQTAAETPLAPLARAADPLADYNATPEALRHFGDFVVRPPKS